MRIFDWQVHFSYGKRVKDNDIPCHYLKIDPEEVLLDKPTVFYFGGTGTNSTMQVNGGLKMLENLLREFSSDVNLIGMHYNYIDSDENEAIDRNIDEFINYILLKHIQKDGAVLDVQEVCKRMRNITIFAHCFGKKIADRMVQKLEILLENLGYRKKDCAKIAGQIFIISHASEPCEKKSHAKTLDVVSPLDNLIDDNNYAWRLLLGNLNQAQISPSDKKELERLIKEYGKMVGQEVQRFYEKNNRVFIVKDKDEIYLAPSMPLDQYWWEHGSKFISRNEEYKANSNATEVGDYVSRCLLCALCNSVANAILNNNSDKIIPFDLDELKLQLEDVVRDFNSKETISYDVDNLSK